MRRTTRLRAALAAILLFCIAGLSACASGEPTADELQNAADARDDGLRTLASIELPSLSGWIPAAVREIDACGSMTSDTDLNEFHIGGYSCPAVRRTVYRLDPSIPSGGLDAAALQAVTEIESAFAEAVAAQENGAFLNVGEDPPMVDAKLDLDGMTVRISAHLTAAAAVDLDILPLWHINQSIGDDDGVLSEKLTGIGVDDERVLLATTTVHYFQQLREGQ